MVNIVTREPAGEVAIVSQATILFVSASPRQYPDLQSNEEYRAIGEGIRKAHRGGLQLQHMPAARPADLLQVVHESPTVLHFSGHGAGERGLCLQADDGSTEYVTAGQLAEVVKATRQAIKIVFLNACYSEAQSQELLQHVPCVIGMFGAIDDQVAIIYARGFYLVLVDGNSVAKAHERDIVALALQPARGTRRDVVLPESASVSSPTLLTRSGVTADDIYITRQPRTRRRFALLASGYLTVWIAAPAAVLTTWHAEDRERPRLSAGYQPDHGRPPGIGNSASEPTIGGDGGVAALGENIAASTGPGTLVAVDDHRSITTSAERAPGAHDGDRRLLRGDPKAHRARTADGWAKVAIGDPQLASVMPVRVDRDNPGVIEPIAADVAEPNAGKGSAAIPSLEQMRVVRSGPNGGLINDELLHVRDEDEPDRRPLDSSPYWCQCLRVQLPTTFHAESSDFDVQPALYAMSGIRKAPPAPHR